MNRINYLMNGLAALAFIVYSHNAPAKLIIKLQLLRLRLMQNCLE